MMKNSSSRRLTIKEEQTSWITMAVTIWRADIKDETRQLSAKITRQLPPALQPSLWDIEIRIADHPVNAVIRATWTQVSFFSVGSGYKFNPSKIQKEKKKTWYEASPPFWFQ